MAAAQTEPAAAGSADRAALERLAFCRLLGDGDVVRGLGVLLDCEAAAARRQLQQGGGATMGSGTGYRTSAQRRREQRRRQAMRAGADGGRNGYGGNGGSGGGVGGMCEELKARTCGGGQMVSAKWLALGERRARAFGVFEPADAGAIGATGAGAAQRAAAEAGDAGRVGWQGQPEGQGQAAAHAVASEPEEQPMAQPMEQQLTRAAERQMEPRAAVAAQPHKRRAVPAATAVGAIGGGGRQPAEAAEISGGEPADRGPRVVRGRTRGARRRLAPYARAAEAGAAEA